MGVTHAAAGFDHAIFATSSGQLRVFGPAFTPAGVKGLHLRDVPLTVPVAALAAGEHHSLVLGGDGSLWALGSNAEGQLGTPAAGPASESPLPVLGPAAGGAKPITAIAAGGRHSLAVDADGRVLAWGWSIHGGLVGLLLLMFGRGKEDVGNAHGRTAQTRGGGFREGGKH